jgi:hypothetical protein
MWGSMHNKVCIILLVKHAQISIPKPYEIVFLHICLRVSCGQGQELQLTPYSMPEDIPHTMQCSGPRPVQETTGT